MAMTSSWHPAAITVPVAAAALAVATSWAVAQAGSDPASMVPSADDLQQAQVQHLERAVQRERSDIRQLHASISRTRDHLAEQKKDVADAANAAAAAAAASNSYPTSTWSAPSTGGTSSSGSSGTTQSSGPTYSAPKPPKPNTTTGSS
jgi:septal ring factor EnvC (AmiA/AmiB activator)